MSKQQTERAGVLHASTVFNGYGWLFREQFVHDYGIDAHVELVRPEEGYPSGSILALQIKSGESFFSEATPQGIVFRPEEKHVKYWLRHCMPVVLLLYSPENERMFWQLASEDTLVSTGKGWKMIIPFDNELLVDGPPQAFFEMDQPEPYVMRLNKLRMDKPWMELLEANEDVIMTFDDWINKSLPRFQVTMTSESRQETWPTIYAAGRSIEDLLQHFIPWADYECDEDEYREYLRSVWEAECYSGYDKETGTTYYTQPFEDWYGKPTKKLFGVPHAGEIESYTLKLYLNDLGRAFLTMDSFLEEESSFEKGTFTAEQLRTPKTIQTKRR